jgi:hypothetical protein
LYMLRYRYAYSDKVVRSVSKSGAYSAW